MEIHPAGQKEWHSRRLVDHLTGVLKKDMGRQYDFA